MCIVIKTNTNTKCHNEYLFLQLRVLARDGGFPSLTATTTVLINVERNLNVPRFLTQNYSVSIYETQDLGVPIQQLSAIDLDVSVSKSSPNVLNDNRAYPRKRCIERTKNQG